jgi:genome maintenance exonuclease 1
VKFPYPDLTTQTYDGHRWYDTPNGFYPSITTILGFTETPEKKASLKRWQDALGAEAVVRSKAATDRGTNVHLLAERYLKKQQVDLPIDGKPVPHADLQSFNALKMELNKIDEVWGQECALYSDSIEIAGRCDCVGTYKGLPVIIDFKTSGKVKGHADIGNYKVQLAFYGLAHNEMYGTNIEDGIILMVSEAGFPQKFMVKLADHMEELRTRAASFWLAALNKHV